MAKHPCDDKPIDDRPLSPKDTFSIAKRPHEIAPVNNKLPSSSQSENSLDLFDDSLYDEMYDKMQLFRHGSALSFGSEHSAGSLWNKDPVGYPNRPTNLAMPSEDSDKMSSEYSDNPDLFNIKNNYNKIEAKQYHH